MQPASSEPPRGFVAAIGAYLIWGLVLPVYMKLLAHVSPLEIVAHRIVWALPFAALILVRMGTLGPFIRSLRPRTIALAAVTASLISVNWGVYVYAIVTGHVVEAALGYYINPLINVLLAAVFLGERPNRAQALAVSLASVGVAVMTVDAGGLPVISLMLALSFGSYGLLRKMLPIEAAEGFTLEVGILFVPALALLGWLAATGPVHFGANALETTLLVGAGPVTAVPLILFAAGARLLRFTTIGLLQYMVPTMLVLTAVFGFGEPFGIHQLVAFGFIWAALAIYTGALLTEGRARRQREVAVEAEASLG